MPRAPNDLKSAFDLNVPRVRPLLAARLGQGEPPSQSESEEPSDAPQLALLHPERAVSAPPPPPPRRESGEWPQPPPASSELRVACAEEAKLQSALTQARAALIRTSVEVKAMLQKVELGQKQLAEKQARLQELVAEIENLEQGRAAAASAKEALEALGKHFGRRGP